MSARGWSSPALWRARLSVAGTADRAFGAGSHERARRQRANRCGSRHMQPSFKRPAHFGICRASGRSGSALGAACVSTLACPLAAAWRSFDKRNRELALVTVTVGYFGTGCDLSPSLASIAYIRQSGPTQSRRPCLPRRWTALFATAAACVVHIARPRSIERVTIRRFWVFFNERHHYAQCFCFATAKFTEPKGERVNMNCAGRIIGVMFAAAIASCATCANAQTGVSTPADAAVNRAAVATAPPRNRPDTVVVRDVRRALSRIPQRDDSRFHVRARVGVVTLTGWVRENWQISRAGNAARSVRGVRSVSNRLAVRG